jgi:hypothetical protein
LITNVTGQAVKGYTPPSVIPTVIRSRNLDVENAELPGGVVTAVIINGSQQPPSPDKFAAGTSSEELTSKTAGNKDPALFDMKSSSGTFSSYVSVSSPSHSNSSVKKPMTEGDEDFVAIL